MLLYLIRHADAVPASADNPISDEDRPLTSTGQAQSKAVAATLQQRGVRLDRILHSPLVRAQETAAGIAAAWSQPGPPLVVCEALGPGGKHKKFARAVNQQGDGSMAAVGHMPDIAELAAWLIGSRKARMDFSKAGIACISLPGDADKGEGTLEWLVTEAWLS
jgi:phosphohistidine phosphatase